MIKGVTGRAVGPLILGLAEAGTGTVVPIVAPLEAGGSLINILALAFAFGGDETSRTADHSRPSGAVILRHFATTTAAAKKYESCL